MFGGCVQQLRNRRDWGSRNLWLEDIVEKIARKHSVQVHEAEQVFQNAPRFRFVETGHREEENVYSASGPTDAGRYVIVFFVLKPDALALPVTARDMTPAEKKMYGRK